MLGIMVNVCGCCLDLFNSSKKLTSYTLQRGLNNRDMKLGTRPVPLCLGIRLLESAIKLHALSAATQTFKSLVTLNPT